MHIKLHMMLNLLNEEVNYFDKNSICRFFAHLLLKLNTTFNQDNSNATARYNGTTKK